MKLSIGTIILLFLVNFNAFCKNGAISDNKVTVDYTMAEKAVDWLEFINTNPGDNAIKDYFMKNVAPTKGCQSIIKHWKRFMEWDNELFYKYIMEALDRIPTDRPLKNEDGSLTPLGKRRMLWTAALANPEIIRDDISKLKKINLADTSYSLAKKYLPENAKIDNDFYFVLFGGSNAFSVGKENGFDILQLNKTADGTIDVESVILILAHEMHHSGFASIDQVDTGGNMLLLGVLAAEGMPTYFINKTGERVKQYKTGSDKIMQDLAAEWETHLKRLPEIYIEAEKDIALNLEGHIGQKEIWPMWMNGLQGQAYVLGSDMFSVIDKYLGVDSAKAVVNDIRQFLRIYNRAARLGNEKGGNYFIFSDALVTKVAEYTD